MENEHKCITVKRHKLSYIILKQQLKKNKLNIQEQLPKYLGEVKLLTTPCVIVETELLGKAAFGAMMIVKQFSVHCCQHTAKPISGSECFKSMLGENNSSRYVIATQDRELQDFVRNVPGTPLLYLHQHTPHLEEPSVVTTRTASEKANSQFGISRFDDAKISSLKSAAFGDKSEEKPRKRKFKSGPNPLSCKKKKKKLALSGSDTKTLDEQDQNTRKKRKRIKLPKHVKECLISNS
ncbi:rRNA-processing protein UTP23 homolog isoform X2 [Macrosteles quadrilineatus]|uniref:rRNA-processing protein UTP23 homolog isoform X2 n=1 Tax=Macrosteles quadrilineatus TaxID=74068 RepID=UPI0023E1E536|nr:rRNA-processing protein UTP23 homolog isoform X2 [Macrosteles quadrilineatus]